MEQEQKSERQTYCMVEADHWVLTLVALYILEAS